jgi:predicted glycogen debranching enzyme
VLIAATKPPVGRLVLLAKFEETLIVNGRTYELGTNQYPGTVHPKGFQFLNQFRLNPFPTSTFIVDGIEIEKTVFMAQGENTTVIEYGLKSTPESVTVKLELRPLIAFRDYHNVTHENGAINSRVDQKSELMNVSPYQGLPTLYLANNAHEVESTGSWYRNFEYAAERELDFQEDLSNPFVLLFDLNSTRKATVIASTEPHDVRSSEE